MLKAEQQQASQMFTSTTNICKFKHTHQRASISHTEQHTSICSGASIMTLSSTTALPCNIYANVKYNQTQQQAHLQEVAKTATQTHVQASKNIPHSQEKIAASLATQRTAERAGRANEQVQQIKPTVSLRTKRAPAQPPRSKDRYRRHCLPTLANSQLHWQCRVDGHT